MGMASAPSSGSNEEITNDYLAEQAVTEIERAYEYNSLSGFMDLLDDDFENKLGFKSSLENEFLNTKNQELQFVIDSTLAEEFG